MACFCWHQVWRDSNVVSSDGFQTHHVFCCQKFPSSFQKLREFLPPPPPKFNSSPLKSDRLTQNSEGIGTFQSHPFFRGKNELLNFAGVPFTSPHTPPPPLRCWSRGTYSQRSMQKLPRRPAQANETWRLTFGWNQKYCYHWRFC